MYMVLDLLDPETHQRVATWKSERTVEMLRMRHGIDIVAYLPTVAQARDWDTTRLEETLERRLRGLTENTGRLQSHSKREVDLTDEDRESLAGAASQNHITRDGYTVIEWETHTPKEDEGGEEQADIQALLDFLKKGREEGAILDNSLYPVTDSVAAGEPSVPTDTSFASSPTHHGQVQVSQEPTELSPAVLQQNPGLGTPGEPVYIIDENKKASAPAYGENQQQQEEAGDDPSVTAADYPEFDPENGPIFEQEERAEEQDAIRQETGHDGDEERQPEIAYSDPGE